MSSVLDSTFVVDTKSSQEGPRELLVEDVGPPVENQPAPSSVGAPLGFAEKSIETHGGKRKPFVCFGSLCFLVMLTCCSLDACV